jgi:carbon-monoxide dehydrogenase medium subunit
MYPSIIDDYQRPSSAADAAAAIAAAGEDAHFIAGGQSLMQAVKSRLLRPRCLIDLQDVAELRGVRANGDLKIGAMTRYAELASDSSLGAAYAAINDAAAHVGDRQVRNRGTIGGSVCWNYIAACMPVVGLGLGMTMNLVSKSRGSRDVGADSFTGSPLETARKADELLVSLSLPAAPRNAGSAYRKWSMMTDGLPVIGACVYVETDGRAIRKARVAFGGLATGPKRSPAAEQALVGCARGDSAGIGKAMKAAAGELEAQADLWADASYRGHLITTLGSEMAARALDRAAG